MVAKTYTVAFEGVEARLVEVQCAQAAGAPGFSVVGLPDKAVSEARERVRAALAAMSIALPMKRLTVNLSPADLPKEGSHFDLPIALAVLGAIGILPPEDIEGLVAIGELALDGRLIPVLGALPAAMAAAETGDDVWGDDPTVLRLQAELAGRAGKEAGLFFPSGTQSKAVAAGQAADYVGFSVGSDLTKLVFQIFKRLADPVPQFCEPRRCGLLLRLDPVRHCGSGADGLSHASHCGVIL
ncbi:MAG: hypothetical protein IE922_12785, partial [Sphingomonadales bacterium]|nr:hypothetical protein [Sphingomonadales bacterium]